MLPMVVPYVVLHPGKGRVLHPGKGRVLHTGNGRADGLDPDLRGDLRRVRGIESSSG
jgi:hypothetical protein